MPIRTPRTTEVRRDVGRHSTTYARIEDDVGHSLVAFRSFDTNDLVVACHGHRPSQSCRLDPAQVKALRDACDLYLEDHPVPSN